MIAVGNTLRRWFESHASLRSILPDGTGLTVRVDTDPDAEDSGRVKVLLSLSVAASETKAVVPFNGSATVTFANRDDIQPVITALEAFNARAHLTDAEAAIHRLSFGNRRSELGPGALPTAIFEFEGLASW